MPPIPPAPPPADAPHPSPVRAAALGAAVAVGALVGFGVRDGRPTTMLGAVGLRLRGLPEFVTPDARLDATAALGGVQAALVAALWALAVGALVRRWRGRGALAVALAAGAALALVAAALPTPLRLAAGVLAPGQRALVALALALAAWAGTRAAPPHGASGAAEG